IVLKPNSARDNDDVSLRRMARNIGDGHCRAGIDDDLAPIRLVDVAVLLPLVDVRLVEGDVIAAPCQRMQQSTIVGGGAIPVGRQEARTVESDLHSAASFAGDFAACGRPRFSRWPSNSSTRWRQVWRARIVASPDAASSRAADGS